MVDNLNGWFGSVRWRYFGQRPLIEDNSVGSRATSLVNARLGYTITSKVRVWVDLSNLPAWVDSDVERPLSATGPYSRSWPLAGALEAPEALRDADQ